MEFAFEDDVRVTEGFYKGYTGVIVENRVTNKKVSYHVKMNHEKLKKKDLWFDEEQLVKIKKLKIPFFNV